MIKLTISGEYISLVHFIRNEFDHQTFWLLIRDVQYDSINTLFPLNNLSIIHDKYPRISKTKRLLSGGDLLESRDCQRNTDVCSLQKQKVQLHGTIPSINFAILRPCLD